MLNVTVKWAEDERILQLPETESEFYKEIAMLLLDIPIPNILAINCTLGSAEYEIKQRGSYVKNGVKKPSMYVVENYNSIQGLTPSSYEEVYFTCVNAESNNYKFYHLKPGANGIDATYGRIGAEKGEIFAPKSLQTPYENHLFWFRYYEKLSKGYVDQTAIYLNKKPMKKTCKKQNSSPVSTVSSTLYNQLRAYAKHVVNVSLVNENVTMAQVVAGKQIYRQMISRKTVKGFNTQLLKLLALSPRKTRNVDELLAYSESDFSEIAAREESLLAAMEAVVMSDDNVSNKDSFDILGVEVYIATDEQKEVVMKHLSDTLKPMVKTVYRVIPKKQNKKFNDYLKKHNIRKVKQLWHGSRNENWLSIIQNGLQLHPNAIITGKMFGNGIYFAPSSLKSWNYTSYRGTYWAGGKSDTAFMGLYATAYGNPHEVTSQGTYSQAILNSYKKNCVHAKAGTALKNDEIIFFDEHAMVLNYIVEFS